MQPQTTSQPNIDWLEKNAGIERNKERLDNAATAGIVFHTYCLVFRANGDEDLIPALLELFAMERELDLHDPQVAKIFYSKAPYAREESVAS